MKKHGDRQNGDAPGEGTPADILSLPEIREGALFVADAHYPHHGREFLDLLEALEAERIDVPQIFLMGDIFDLLFGYSDYIAALSRREVELLRRLSERTEIHYLEGNHDFLLGPLFPKIDVVPRERQPLRMRLGERPVMLSHGDLYRTGAIYDLYCRLLRRRKTLRLLKPLERKIIDGQIARLKNKKICGKLPDFSGRVAEILSDYSDGTAMVIEGHFHQGGIFGRYVSLPSLACQKQVAVVEKGEIVFRDLSGFLSR